MLKIKGFLNSGALIDNTPNGRSKFCEISSYARTFSKDPLEFTDPRWAGLELVVLCNKNTIDNTVVSIGTEFVSKTLEILHWVYTNSPTNTVATTRNDFMTQLLNQFNGQIGNMNCGELQSDGVRRMPTWISWTQVSNTENEIRFWLTNEALEADYDEYEIVVVPPLTNVNTFFQATSEVMRALGQNTPVTTMDAIHSAKNKKPETMVRAEVIPYTNQTMGGEYVNTTWHAVIYGPAGDTTDRIKEAIIAYIQNHSSEPLEQWKIVFPDIFRTTEMFILPRWDKVAIPFRTVLAGLYSPITSASNDLLFTKGKLTFVPSQHVDNHLEVTHHKYRSIALLCLGGTDNKDAKYKLSDYIPDYIAENSTHQDYNRMAEISKQWTLMVEEMLILAEKITEGTTLPVNTRRATRAGVDFISRKLNGVDYLLAVKTNG